MVEEGHCSRCHCEMLVTVFSFEKAFTYTDSIIGHTTKTDWVDVYLCNQCLSNMLGSLLRDMHYELRKELNTADA